MAIVDTSIEIARTPAQVRAVVLDFDRMHEWHTRFLKVMRPLPPGSGKTPEQMQPGDDMYLKFLQVASTVKIVENSETRLAWEGGPALLFHGVHALSFEPLDDGKRTLFTNGEVFTGLFGQGVALPGIHSSVRALYEGYNEDLRRRCEQEADQTKGLAVA